MRFTQIAIAKLISGRSISKTFKTNIEQEFTIQPLQNEEILTQEDISHLPDPVQKYLIYSCALGRPKPQNVRIEFEAEMFRKQGEGAMKAYSCQYNFLGNYSRIFLMRASKMLVPFRALHIYRNFQATFKVRVANLFNAVNIKGEKLTSAETVTILNDMCLFAPGNLIDKRLTWKEIDSLTSEVVFINGSYKVSAILYFNVKGELINFVSDDRSALQDDGSMKIMRWITPVKEYREIDGRMVPTYGETIWSEHGNDFTYGKFHLKSIVYNFTF
jgi:hypothetical protein